jgi:hypothetical protein
MQLFLTYCNATAPNSKGTPIMQAIIHLSDGDTVTAEVNGRSLDGQTGFVFLAVDCGSLLTTLLESRVIEVTQRPDGEWEETSL